MAWGGVVFVWVPVCLCVLCFCAVGVLWLEKEKPICSSKQQRQFINKIIILESTVPSWGGQGRAVRLH